MVFMKPCVPLLPQGGVYNPYSELGSAHNSQVKGKHFLACHYFRRLDLRLQGFNLGPPEEQFFILGLCKMQASGMDLREIFQGLVVFESDLDTF